MDTSALVKLYVAERNTDAVRRAVAAATRVGTSRVAYPEARASFARRHREGGLGMSGLRRVVADLDRDWSSLVVVELLDTIARRAGELAESHRLRGFDAIHLASALELREICGARFSFMAFNAPLSAAAVAMGL